MKAKERTCAGVFNPTGFSFVTKGAGFIYLGAGTLRFSCSRPVPSFGFVRGRLARQRSRFRGAMMTVRTEPNSSMFGGGISGIFRHCVARCPRLRFYLGTRSREMDASSLFSSNIVCCKDSYVGRHDCVLFAVAPSGCACRLIGFWVYSLYQAGTSTVRSQRLYAAEFGYGARWV